MMKMRKMLGKWRNLSFYLNSIIQINFLSGGGSSILFSSNSYDLVIRIEVFVDMRIGKCLCDMLGNWKSFFFFSFFLINFGMSSSYFEKIFFILIDLPKGYSGQLIMKSGQHTHKYILFPLRLNKYEINSIHFPHS